MNKTLLRWFLLLTGGLIGAVLGAAHCYIIYRVRAPFPHDSFGEKAMIIAGLSTFFLCLYNIGIWGFGLFGEQEEARTVAAEKKTQMFVLNFLGLAAIVAAWFFD